MRRYGLWWWFSNRRRRNIQLMWVRFFYVFLSTTSIVVFCNIITYSNTCFVVCSWINPSPMQTLSFYRHRGLFRSPSLSPHSFHVCVETLVKAYTMLHQIHLQFLLHFVDMTILEYVLIFNSVHLNLTIFKFGFYDLIFDIWFPIT